MSATTVAGAAVALAGAIGLAAGGAAQAATPSTGHKAPVQPAIPALPDLQDVAADLTTHVDLPPSVDKALRDLLPKRLPIPEQHRHTAVRPVHGTVTSGYGARWGVVHYGVDIANEIGTPIYAVTDGTVIESGPASGFGQWVRVRQDDGTIGVFGHIDQSFVKAGQKVKAGDQIATVGNRGNSTGPHLHYEVWDKNGNKINPQVWLKKRGVSVD